MSQSLLCIRVKLRHVIYFLFDATIFGLFHVHTSEALRLVLRRVHHKFSLSKFWADISHVHVCLLLLGHGAGVNHRLECFVLVLF